MSGALLDGKEGKKSLPLKTLIFFFLPLGFSASLVTLSHVTIQSTLARSAHPEATIAGYAIAMSVFTIMERPAVLLRQTCSALVRDRISFRAMTHITCWLLLFTIGFGLSISYTPAGSFLFRSWFHADEQLMDTILHAYRILMFVTVFSAIRCLFHGIIIRNMQTKWLTLGMMFRLAVMYALSMYFIHAHKTIDGSVGAIIFLSGMMVEALVSAIEGSSILRTLPVRDGQSSISSMKDVFPFYRPLVYSAFISVIIAPSINALLGKTYDIQLAVASYALALGVTNLVTSFYTYVHQIVLNFYRIDPKAVRTFAAAANLIPALLIGFLAYTSLGPWFLSQVMGVKGELLRESISVLRVFMLLAGMLPWVDFCNGLVLLEQKTKVMVWSQAGNVLTMLTVLITGVWLMPAWNGLVGALAQSLGLSMELAVLLFFLRRRQRSRIAYTVEI